MSDPIQTNGQSVEEITEGRTIWNSDGSEPCLICAPPTTSEEAATLRAQASRIASEAEAVSDSSEYPRLALMACREQSSALNNLADTLEAEGAPAPKRPGMTGEERRERRASILRIRSARAKVEAANHLRASHDIGSRIPFGQPILVGHHSERGHRRAIERMHGHDSKGYGALKYSEELERRADSVERHATIQASDSDAVEQYKRKLIELEQRRAEMKRSNEAWRLYAKHGDASKLKGDLGLNDADIQKMADRIAAAYSWEKQPFPGWALTNIGARIRDIEKKLARLEIAKATPEKVIETDNGIRVEDSPADNRIRLFFPGKPDEATRAQLKRNGYRWAPSLGCWQAYRNWSALEHAKTFITPKGATE